MGKWKIYTAIIGGVFFRLHDPRRGDTKPYRVIIMNLIMMEGFSHKFSYDGRSRPTNDLYSQNYDKIFNPTLTKNMPNVKWDQIPPVKGPNSQGIANENVSSKNKLVKSIKKVSK